MSKWKKRLKNCSKHWKKILAGTLAGAMVISTLNFGWGTPAEVSADVVFDEDHVVLKMGVLADVHLSYGLDSASTIKSKVERYAKAVGTLNAMSGKDLDVLMLAGDYTGYGMYEQGKTFASASKAILDAINEGKTEEEKTQFFFTYGNHDTEWAGQMSYAEWESLFGEYGLMDGVTYGPENSGSYKYTKTIDGKTYYFFSVETETYYWQGKSNLFRTDVLEWLDKELAATPTDAYVYVLSHAPIKETGVYGADMDYDKNADWGTAKDEGYSTTITRNDGNETKDTTAWETSSDIDSILKKYAHVLYLSGHTHRTNKLESTIMSDNYTAVTISQFMTGDLYSENSNYLDASGGDEKPGYVLYIEVDAKGNQRITRVDTSDNSMIASLTINGSLQENVKENPTSEASAKAKVDAYYTDSIAFTYNDGASAKTLTPWVMKAPTANGAHLLTYSAENRKENPVFGSGALTLNEVTNNAGEEVKIAFSFPTAKCEDSYVIRYEFMLRDSSGRILDTQWILGNWTTNTDGVSQEEIDAGKTHQDATSLSYEKTYTKEELAGVSGIYATITAVNEFGGRTTLTSGTDAENIGIIKPVAADTNKNLFDYLTVDRIHSFSNQEKVNAVFDKKGKAAITFETAANDELVFDLSKNGTTLTKSWGWVGRYADQLTDIKPEDTFVYETDFSVETNGKIYFTFRATQCGADGKAWKHDYSGIWMDANQICLELAGTQIAKTDKFKLELNTTYHMVVVSTPTAVSVWMDDELIFDNVGYDVRNLSDFAGTGTTEDPYRFGDFQLKSADMVPVIGFYANSASKFTVSNQYCYLYNKTEQVRDEWGATEKNYYDKNNVTVNGQLKAEEILAGGFKINGTATNNDYAQNCVKVDLSDALGAEDKVITEFDYTPTNLVNTDASDWSKMVAIALNFRSNGEENGSIRLLMRINGGQNLLHIKDGMMDWLSPGISPIKEGQKVHVKLVHDAEKVSIYINGKAVIENRKYCDIKTSEGEGGNVENMKPIFELGLLGADWKIENVVIRKADGSGTIEGITPVTSDNNLLSTNYGEIVSSFKDNKTWEGMSDSIVNGNNFYSDMTWMNLDENGNGLNYYMGEVFYFFGKENKNLHLNAKGSYVMSALVRAANESLKKEETGPFSSRISFTPVNYDGKNVWYFIQDTSLNIYNGDNHVKTIDLAKEMGYAVGDYIRVTTVVTPFGFDIYMDGTKIYTYNAGKTAKVDYSVAQMGVNGAEVRFCDTAVWYNTDNKEVYVDKLQEEVRGFETLKGVWFENASYWNKLVKEIKNACSKCKSAEELWKYVGAFNVDKITSSGKVVNNLVYDKTTAISKDVIGLFGTSQYEQKMIPLFDNGKCPLTTEDTWVVEMDVKNYDFPNANWAPRLGIKLLDDGYIFMIQSGTVFMENAGGWQNGDNLTDDLYNNGEGIEWHIRYEVVKNEKVNITVTSLDGKTIYLNTSMDVSKFIKNYNTDTEYTFSPSLFYSNQNVQFTNVYVGYDLSEDVQKVKDVLAQAENKDLSSYTSASVEHYKAIETELTELMKSVTTSSVNTENAVYTAAYTAEEMTDAVRRFAEAEAALEVAAGTLTIGNDVLGKVEIAVTVGDTLPTGYLGDKYIIGWTVNGESVTTIDDADLNLYVPEYIDIDMLAVKVQAKQNEQDNTCKDIRLIASLNALVSYENAGFVISAYDKIPEVGKDNCLAVKTMEVFEKLYAAGQEQTAAQIYGNEYSKYLCAYEYTGLSQDAKIYVRAYVTLPDGRVVYGTTSAFAVNSIVTE